MTRNSEFCWIAEVPSQSRPCYIKSLSANGMDFTYDPEMALRITSIPLARYG